MPAPTNDNLASATAISGETGFVSGSNVGATGQGGEEANAGLTVWWKWTPPRLGFFRFKTRYNANGNPQTDFDTFLSVYRGPDTAPTFASLANVGQGGSYAAWDIGSEVRFEVTSVALTTYYIRVDGRLAGSGAILLSWEPFIRQSLASCTDCAASTNPGETCMATIVIDPTLQAYYSFGAALPPGTYAVRYCSGVWRYSGGDRPDFPSGPPVHRPDFTLSRTPPFTNQTWPGQVSAGYWMHIYHSNRASGPLHFGEVLPPSFGYATAELAEAAMTCKEVVCKHTGGAVELYFTDNQYNDNVIGERAPRFACYRIRAKFIFVRVAMSIDGTGRRNCILYVQNTVGYPFNGINIEVVHGGEITGSVDTVTLNFPTSTEFPNFGVLGFLWNHDESPVGKTDSKITLRLSEGTGADLIRYDDLPVDFTPVLVTKMESVGPLGSCPTGSRNVVVSILNQSGGCTYALVATADTATGCVLMNDSCATLSSRAFTVGQIGAPQGKTFLTIPVKGAGACSFVLHLVDGPLTHPPALISFSI